MAYKKEEIEATSCEHYEYDMEYDDSTGEETHYHYCREKHGDGYCPLGFDKGNCKYHKINE